MPYTNLRTTYKINIELTTLKRQKDRGYSTLLQNYGYCRVRHKQNQNKQIVNQTAEETSTLTYGVKAYRLSISEHLQSLTAKKICCSFKKNMDS